MNLTQAEIEMLEACKNPQEWNNACDQVKQARNGQYPPDWWPTMKMSGRMDRILNSFGQSSEIRYTTL